MPESLDALVQAHSALDVAEKNLAIGLPRIAAREAYMAVFHAARALIFERTQKRPKTHHGVKTSFRQIIQDGLAFPKELVGFLDTGFNFKADADYGMGQLAGQDGAEEALETARAFVAAAKAIVRGA
jgi:uncharacterized protein (UPF0332 family)